MLSLLILPVLYHLYHLIEFLVPPTEHTQLTATVAPTVNVVTNAKEEKVVVVSVCVRDVMVLLASVETSASVLKDAANALNAVSSLSSVGGWVHS